MSRAPFVLVVDDDRHAGAVLAHLLRSGGFRAEAVRDALSGVGVARKDRPDLILMDLMMPSLDGGAATQMIQSSPELRGIPVIMMSAMPEAEARRRAAECGAVDFLPKPFMRGELVEAVRRRVGDVAGSGAPAGDATRVLVIDDDPVVVRVLAAALRKVGFGVWEAGTARDGLELARKLLPGLIITDVGLPDIDGTELCIQLKSAPDTGRIPVIFISGRADEETHRVAEFAGGTAFMDKPVDLGALVRTIEGLLRPVQA